MIVLGIDPGTTESSWVLYDGPKSRVVNAGHEDNNLILMSLREKYYGRASIFAIEQVEAMGMAVGREVFETVFWTGRFAEAIGIDHVRRVTRRQVKLHLCGSMQAKDANIRQALLDKFGGAGAIGRKHAPGPLYGIASHKWSALAVAVTWWETKDKDTVKWSPLATTGEF